MPSSRSWLWDVRLWLLIYVPALLAGILLTPLWLPEIVQLIGSAEPNVARLSLIIPISPDTPRFTQLLYWVAGLRGESPLGFLLQYPFVVLLGAEPWIARLSSVLCAVANVFLFWQVVRRVAIRNEVLAVILFCALPIHYHYAVEARPYELGMTALLVAALCFLRTMETPTVMAAVWYGLSLVFCLYAVPRSILPAAGFGLTTLAFIASKDVRRALWHILPATAGAGLLYVPFFVWAQRVKLPFQIYASDTYWLSDSNWQMALRDIAGGGDAGYVLVALLLIGAGVGVWRALQYSAASEFKKIALVTLFGGAVINAAVSLATDVFTNVPLNPAQLFWSAPGFIVVLAAGLDWLETKVRFAAWAYAALFFGFCVVGDYTFLTSRTENIKGLAEAALPEARANSCVVFVSEGLSPFLFRTMEPRLGSKECGDFFFKRVVLLSQPYVTADQQHDAEIYFRGLSMHEVKRIRVGGGQIVVVESL